MHERFGRENSSLPTAPIRDDFMMLPPDSLAILADVREQRGLLLFHNTRNVDIGVRQKALRLASTIHLEKVEAWPLPHGHAGANCQKARHLVVHMRIDRPMSKDYIGTFRCQELCHSVYMGACDFRRAIDLAKEQRF